MRGDKAIIDGWCHDCWNHYDRDFDNQMKPFIKKLFQFSAILFLMVTIGAVLPPTPRASTSHLFGKLKMDSLLKNAASPRLILIGGSNLSLTINSQLLKDSLGFNPINTAISWSIGFVYMFDRAFEYVRPGDVIVASIEYDQFYNKAMFGGDDLVRTIFDVSREDLFKLRGRQYSCMVSNLPYYSFTKYKPTEYIFKRNPEEVYDREATNQYGDNCKHWNLSSRIVDPVEPLPTKYDKQAFEILSEFKTAIERKGAFLFITFPAFQQSSFKNQEAGIRDIEKEFKRRNFSLVGSPKSYVMPDALLFDTPYHLIKAGVDLRTKLLIADLKLAFKEQHLLKSPPLDNYKK